MEQKGMTKEHLMRIVESTLNTWVTAKSTGTLVIEVNTNNGHIGRCYVNYRELLEKTDQRT